MSNLREYMMGGLLSLSLLTVGYVVYFDHKRRSDPLFRRNLKIDRKKAEKISQTRTQKKKLTKQQSMPDGLLESLKDDPEPKTQQEKEAYFMRHLEAGEKLLGKGPKFYEDAAGCFFRVLNIYPDPMQLLAVLESTIPAPVFNLVMQKMVSDIKKKQDEYQTHFPPASQNVEITEVHSGDTPEGKKLIRRGLLIRANPVKKGQTIYSEFPLVSARLPELKDSYCWTCLTATTDNFCSAECKQMGIDMYGAEDLCVGVGSGDHQLRMAEKLEECCLEGGLVTPLLVGKFLANMIFDETKGKVQGNTASMMTEYSLWDHIDRFHYIDLLKPTKMDESGSSTQKEIWFQDLDMIKTEAKLLSDLFNKVPKFDRFLTEERYIVLKGKFLYNALAIRDPESTLTPTNIKEYFKTDKKTGIVGVGLYHTTTYLSHSCAPNVKVVFGKGGEIDVVALKDLKVGEELFLSFLDKDGLGVKERRKVLKQKYRFLCKCTTCS